MVYQQMQLRKQISEEVNDANSLNPLKDRFDMSFVTEGACSVNVQGMCYA